MRLCCSPLVPILLMSLSRTSFADLTRAISSPRYFRPWAETDATHGLSGLVLQTSWIPIEIYRKLCIRLSGRKGKHTSPHSATLGSFHRLAQKFALTTQVFAYVIPLQGSSLQNKLATNHGTGVWLEKAITEGSYNTLKWKTPARKQS